jgi:hypothetical protein
VGRITWNVANRPEVKKKLPVREKLHQAPAWLKESTVVMQTLSPMIL